MAYNKTKKKLSDDRYIYLKYTAIKRKPLPRDTHTNTETQKETKKPPVLKRKLRKTEANMTNLSKVNNARLPSGPSFDLIRGPGSTPRRHRLGHIIFKCCVIVVGP